MNLLEKSEIHCLNCLNFEKVIKKLSFFNNQEENIFRVFSHNGDIVVVTLTILTNLNVSIKSLEFKLYDLSIPNSPPKWQSRLETIAQYYNNDEYIERFFIRDNISRIENQGYSSLLMSTFLQYIDKFQAKEIYGSLSFVDESDEDNRNRRNHLYRKFGFDVDEENHTIRKIMS